MKLTKTFEIDKEKAERITAFFATQGYKMEKGSANSYRFKRWSGWANLYSFDVRKLSTTVDVDLMATTEGRYQVLVNYDINAKGVIITGGDREKIEAEMEGLEVFTKIR
jgi:hypothetical protein